MNNTASSKQKKIQSETIDDTRRGFLKKATYIPPTLIIMGSLSRPKDANAQFGPPPSAPNF